MCIIIHKPEPGVLDEEILAVAEFMNPDGFGITYLDELRTHRTMDYKKAAKWAASDRPFVAHYRYATRGKVNKASCHPYPFTGGWLYSNGTVETLGDKEVCDTEVVARYLATVPREYWPQLLSMTATRFCIVLKDGTVERHGNWFERDGIFYSKDSCFPRPVSRKWSGSTAQPPWDTYSSATFGTGRTRADQWAPSRADYGYIDEEEGTIISDTEPVRRDLGRIESDFDFDEGDDGSNGTLSDVEEYIADFVDTEEDAFDGWQGQHLLAVYGTLKRGHGNHRLLDTSLLLSEGVTVERLRMTGSGVPYVYHGEHRDGDHISVEVYHVTDERVRADIDRLEGHPNWYRRQLTEIELDGGTIVYAWLYFMQGEPPAGAKFYNEF